ncbi:MAG: M20 family metallopeptidase [Planctomycetes bacterium]|nr:M20 family metallopeptidase [Planctomycetota bacterium]
MESILNISQEQRIEVFRRLIAFDTTSANSNAPAADDLAGFLEDHGCQIARFESDGGKKVNLVAHKGPDCEGGLLLSGHLDVVPAAEDGWHSDPFVLTETSDRYVARGSADMKGFVSLATCLLAGVDATRMKRPLVGLFTHDEEIGTIGAQMFCKQWDKRWHLPTSCIVGEPTELNVIRMHKGHLKLRIDVQGKSAHSGYPHLGSNAIETMGRVISMLSSLRKEFESQRCETSRFFPQTPYPILNMATVSGGSAINIVPDACSLDIGIRVLPGQRSKEAMATLSRAIAEIDGVSVSLIGDSPPFLTPESAQINARLCEHTGQTETVAASYASDAGPLSTMGIESVLYGPGY